VKVETDADRYVFEAQVYLDDFDPNAVRVELYADGVDGDGPVRQEMMRVRALVGAVGDYAYSATVPATRPVTDYTARAIPRCPGVAVPLEALTSCGSGDSISNGGGMKQNNPMQEAERPIFISVPRDMARR
jgi:hypothetical protein